ncbi:50S ribosomal protein L32 [Patescibacteria group bacterium]|nr:MAG: 50S ribosomal protein L32 [Patescibacteria group bacterium]
MSTQKQHKTKARRDRRRVRFTIKTTGTVTCPKCAKPILAHRVCASCGYYKGKEVINTLKKTKKKK